MSRAAALVALTATLLSAVIAFELKSFRADRQVEADARSSPIPGETVPPQPPDKNAEDLKIWVASILRRPLFSPNRHPAAVTTASGSGLPRLTGIIITPSDKRALFAAPDGRTLISLGEGGRLGAYTMQLIEAGQITIDGPSGTRVLHPAFKSAQEEQTAANVPPTPPFPPPRPPMPWSSRNRAAR